MFESLSQLPPQIPSIKHALIILPTAAALGAALGMIRPIRKSLVPRSSHVIQTQVLLAIVGAVIMLVVAESLARAFAIVGAAGLVRYRAKIEDPKDAGVLLVALAAGLAVGSGLLLLATISCGFVVAILWLLESIEPPDKARFDLTVDSKDTAELRPRIEHALRQRGVRYELWGSSPARLRYEVTLPLHMKTQKLTKLIKKLNGHNGTSVEWNIKKFKTVQT
jgi:MgtC family